MSRRERISYNRTHGVKQLLKTDIAIVWCAKPATKFQFSAYIQVAQLQGPTPIDFNSDIDRRENYASTATWSDIDQLRLVRPTINFSRGDFKENESKNSNYGDKGIISILSNKYIIFAYLTKKDH